MVNFPAKLNPLQYYDYTGTYDLNSQLQLTYLSCNTILPYGKKVIFAKPVNNSSGWRVDVQILDEATNAVTTVYNLSPAGSGWPYWRVNDFFWRTEDGNDYLYYIGFGNKYKINLATRTKTDFTIGFTPDYQYPNEGMFHSFDNMSKQIWGALVSTAYQTCAFYLVDINGGWTKTDLFKFPINTDALKMAFYYKGKVFYHYTKVLESPNYAYLFMFYDIATGAVTEVYRKEAGNYRVANPYGGAFIYKDVVWFIGGSQQHNTSTTQYEYVLYCNAFDLKSLKFYTSDLLVYREFGTFYKLWGNIEQRMNVFLNYDKELDDFPLLRYNTTQGLTNQNNIGNFTAPYREIPSIKGATYKLDKDVYINFVTYPANVEFVLNSNDTIKLSVFDETVNGTIKIPSQEI